MSDEVGGILNIIGLLREKKSLWLVAAALVLGICLMLFGGRGDNVSIAATAGGGIADTGALEAKVAALCERVLGVSEVSVMITLDTHSESTPQVGGIAVVCKGGDDTGIRLTLTELLCALFSVPSSSVSVVGGK